MKTNRRPFRTCDAWGDKLFTKRQANKRNRKVAKNYLTKYGK